MEILTPNQVILKDNFVSAQHFNLISKLSSKLGLHSYSGDIWESHSEENTRLSSAYIWTDQLDLNFLKAKNPLINLFPTNTILDQTMLEIVALASKSSLFGELGKDWIGISMSFFYASPGNEMKWHNDDKGYKGAFVYYVHEKWQSSWGGELLIKTEDLSSIGQFVDPIPNRIVFIKGGTPHCVKGIDKSCPIKRSALAGFFITPELAETKIKSAYKTPGNSDK